MMEKLDFVSIQAQAKTFLRKPKRQSASQNVKEWAKPSKCELKCQSASQKFKSASQNKALVKIVKSRREKAKGELKRQSASQNIKVQAEVSSTSWNVKVLKFKYIFTVQAHLKVKTWVEWSQRELIGQSAGWMVKVWVCHGLLFFCPLSHYLEAWFL